MSHICFYPERLQSGIGRVTLNLASSMLERGVQVDMILTKREGALVEQIPEGVRVIEGKGSVGRSLGTLYHYLRREKPDALVTAHTHVNIVSIALCKLAFVPTKVMVTIHTATSRDDESGKSKRKRLNKALSKLTYPFADHIVAVSSPVADDLAEYLGLKRERIEVIYNPVVGQAMLDKSKSDVEHPFFESGEQVILSVGRLTEQKDYATLLRAFQKLREHKKAKLIILGEGEEREALEKLAQSLGVNQALDLPGFLPNPYAFMRKADLFVSSSAWEGLPTVMIEALALGLPVVATDCPGGTREILENGKVGRLTAVADAPALATAMLESLNSQTNTLELEKRGLSFSEDASADHYLRSLGLNSHQQGLHYAH